MQPATVSADDTMVRLVYNNLLQAWNNADGPAFAALFARQGSTIGFDGTEANGREEIEKHLSAIFANHKTASYVNVIREVVRVATDVYMLRAVVGMVPPGQTDLHPDRNAVQTVIFQLEEGKYRIVLLQNTALKYDGRPEAVTAVMKELRQALELAKDA